jgi:hypothetical protein
MVVEFATVTKDEEGKVVYRMLEKQELENILKEATGASGDI